MTTLGMNVGVMTQLVARFEQQASRMDESIGRLL